MDSKKAQTYTNPSLEWETESNVSHDKLMEKEADNAGQSKKQDQTCCRVATYILIGLALLLSLTTLVLTIVVYLDRDAEPITLQKPLEIKEPICLPCIQLVYNPYQPYQADPVLEQLTKHLTNGVQMCCAGNNEQLSALLEAVLRKPQLELPPGIKTDDKPVTPLPSSAHPDGEKSLKFVPASAHKKVYSSEVTEGDEQGAQHAVLKLRQGISDFVEHLRKISVDDTNSSLVIEYTGLYHVYLNIHFQILCDLFSETDFKNMFWYIQRISLISPDNSGMLIQTSYTVPASCVDGDSSVHAGGVFYLKAGDKLLVCSTPEIAGQIGEASTLGLAMLAS